MTFKPKHKELLKVDDIKRWHENLRARSPLSADVMLRNLGLYCEICCTDPKNMLEDAKDITLRNQFSDFVRRMEKEGKAGSYISKFKFAIRSWLKFNFIDYDLNVNIRNSDSNPTVENERVPTKEELTKIIRESKKRGRVSIALMAFSGLRPESLGDYEGKDGLRVGDIPDLKLEGGKAFFENIPARIVVRKNFSKARIQYNTFIGQEGCDLILEYLNERLTEGESLDENSPLLRLVDQNFRKHERMRTVLVTRDIREGIVKAGLKFRPYVLRAYFATAMDIAESKGFISHAWRMHFMGHKGDIEHTYSTNKNLLPVVIEEMRNVYGKCLPYIETREVLGQAEMEQAKQDFKGEYLKLFFSDEEIDEHNLIELDAHELQERIKEKQGMRVNNGHRQKVISQSEIKHYIEDLGWEYVRDLGSREAIVWIPE